MIGPQHREEDASGAWGLYYGLLTGIVREAAGDVTLLGVDVKEFLVLNDVEACPYPAPLAERLAVPRATMTGYLKSLEAKRLIERTIDPTDMRRHRLTLTKAGRQAVARGRVIFSGVFGRRLERLDPGERAIFHALLEKLHC